MKNIGSSLNITFLLIAISILIFIFVDKTVAILILTLALILLIFRKNYVFKLIKANKLYNKKDYVASLNLYREIVNNKKVTGSIVNNYLILELKYGDASTAEEFINTHTDYSKYNEGDILSINVSKALISWKNNKIEQAITDLKNLLQSGKNTYIYETLTSLLIVNGYIDDALTIVNEGLEYTDSSNVLKSNLAEAKFLSGSIDESKEIFKELIDNNVSFIEPYYYYGTILMKEKEYGQALDMFNKALTLNDSLVSLIKKKQVENSLSELSLLTNN